MKIKITLGRHCCLWCVIKSQQLKESSSTRRRITPRSIDSIANDYEGFVKAGGLPTKSQVSQQCDTKTLLYIYSLVTSMLAISFIINYLTGLSYTVGLSTWTIAYSPYSKMLAISWTCLLAYKGVNVAPAMNATHQLLVNSPT